MEKDWLDSLKDRMESYEESTPEGLWDSISSAVGKQEKKRSTTAILPWVWRSAAAAAVVAIGVFASGLLSDKTSLTKINNNSVALQEQDSTSPNVPNPSSSVIPVEDGASASECANLASQSGRLNLLAQAEIPEVSEPGRDVLSSQEEQSLAEDEAGAPVVIEQGPVTPPSKEEAVDMYIPESVTNHDGEDWSGRMSVCDDLPKSPFIAPASVETSFSGAVTDSKNVGTFDPSTFYRGQAPSESTSDDNSGNDNPSGSAPKKVSANKIPSVTNTTKHERPIRAAVTARWKFGSVIGIETGAEWSQLTSTFSTTSGNTVNEKKQALQYVGIPLNLTADIFDKEKFTLYVSAGGMVEKCISAKAMTTEYVSGERINTPQSTSFMVDPLLYSLNAAAGAQFNFLGNFGLYFEPGVSYHFNDGSDVETIYKERPFDFVMTFGLRYSFR